MLDHRLDLHLGHQLRDVVRRVELTEPLVADLQLHVEAAEHVAGIPVHLLDDEREGLGEAIQRRTVVAAGRPEVLRLALVTAAVVHSIADSQRGHFDEILEDLTHPRRAGVRVEQFHDLPVVAHVSQPDVVVRTAREEGSSDSGDCECLAFLVVVVERAAGAVGQIEEADLGERSHLGAHQSELGLKAGLNPCQATGSAWARLAHHLGARPESPGVLLGQQQSAHRVDVHQKGGRALSVLRPEHEAPGAAGAPPS